jgi:hypothetical protein
MEEAVDFIISLPVNWKEKIYIITSGYSKKSNKTDKNQIEKAMMAMKQIKEE